MKGHQIAQLNVALMRASPDDPVMAEFFENIDKINRLAENSAGFVWRLKTDEGDATSIRIYDDERILVNMSVWDSIEALKDFVYRTTHSNFVRRRKEWYEHYPGAYYVLWWVPAGHTPSLEEAVRRLERLDRLGPTPEAFNFAKVFEPVDSESPT